MNSDTVWIEGVGFLLKHKDGQFTWRSGAYSSTKVKFASSCIISITLETVTACHEGGELSGVCYTFNDGDLDTKWGLLNPFERGLDVTNLPKVISAGKLLPYTKEGDARAFIYASLEEQDKGEKGRGRDRGRGKCRGRGKGNSNSNSKSKSKRKTINNILVLLVK